MGRRRRQGQTQAAMVGLIGFALGAVGALLLAPKSGRDSRTWIGGQAGKVGKSAGDALGQVGSGLRDGAERIKDSALDLTRRFRADDPASASDEIVMQRVRSELGRMTAFAELRGQYLLDVSGGIVTVRGELSNPDLSAALMAAISGVDGVTAVESRLHRDQPTA